MAVTLFIIGLAVSGTPIIAAVLVSMASRREDSEGTLGGSAPGPVRAVARLILAFHTETGALPQPSRRAMTSSGVHRSSRNVVSGSQAPRSSDCQLTTKGKREWLARTTVMS